ncbi:hypothetical protein ACAL30_000989 [Campylobacter jejuni]|nr:hypothetical protein [Campylobacter jejuni]EDP8137666.1 hypothetical protein [Campylobacter jejuni]HDZ4294972.1 hypothetical protein [Campylobacter jejuni]HEG1490470.1 hypothetical protein [Campylobacter jejuni]
MQEEIAIKGNSGCFFDVSDGEIFKYTTDIKYVGRLKLQCAKQKFFSNLLTEDLNIKIPNILGEGVYLKNGYGFNMQYCYADNFITFFENFDMQSILSKIDIVLRFIDNNINNCEMVYLDKNIIKNKLESLYKIFFTLSDLKQHVNCINNILNNELYLFDNFKFPVGLCHGDLTFSNILFQRQNIVLIDFLDNFIETPLQDMVKLRQDTKHKWSLNMIQTDCDEIKIKIILNYLDEYIHQHFLKYQFYQYFYNIFQKINLLRILPYTKNNVIINYIINEINILQKER